MVDEEEASKRLLEKEVAGTTFRVDLYMLRTEEASARQVYRDLEMSSPYLAAYHLDKLHHLRLVEKDERGVYHANPKNF